MFNKNTFLQHTINTTNHNKMTRAGVNAPFSMNEQFNLKNGFNYYGELLPSSELMVPNFRKEYDGANTPRTQSGDTRTDVPRTGSPGKNNPVIKMNPTEKQATPYDEELHTGRHTSAIESNQGGNLYRKHDPMGFHIDRAVEQWRNSGSKPGEPSNVNKMDVARGHFHNYVQDLTRNGEFNQMYRPNMDNKSKFYKTHFNQFMQGMDVAHREMEQ